jgi:hypothetical protein
MRKIALPLLLFITLYSTLACTPRPDELPVGDTNRVALPPPASDSLARHEQTDTTRVNYILPMDTTSIRDSASFTLIKVGGPLGDGCQKFEYIDSVKEGSILNLTFWASRPKDPNTVCTQQMQYVERQIRVAKGAYSQLSVAQPQGKPPLVRPL